MPITATEIQRRRLTALTIVRSIGLAGCLYAIHVIANTVYSIADHGLTYISYAWQPLTYATLACLPLVASLLFPRRFARLLVPLPTADECGACGYSIGNPGAQHCPECGIRLLPIEDNAECNTRQFFPSRYAILLCLRLWIRIVGVAMATHAIWTGIRTTAYTITQHFMYTPGADGYQIFGTLTWIVQRNTTTVLLLVLGLWLFFRNDKIAHFLMPPPDLEIN